MDSQIPIKFPLDFVSFRPTYAIVVGTRRQSLCLSITLLQLVELLFQIDSSSSFPLQSALQSIDHFSTALVFNGVYNNYCIVPSFLFYPYIRFWPSSHQPLLCHRAVAFFHSANGESDRLSVGEWLPSTASLLPANVPIHSLLTCPSFLPS